MLRRSRPTWHRGLEPEPLTIFGERAALVGCLGFAKGVPGVLKHPEGMADFDR